MSMTSPDQNITNVETSNDVPTIPETAVPPAVLPSSSGSGQTAEEIEKSNGPNPAPVTPPITSANNATGVTVSNNAVRQPSSGDTSGNQINQVQPDLDTVEKAARKTGTYSGALITTASVVPVIAALVSALAYIAHWPQGVTLPDWLAAIIGTPLLLGTIPTLIVWLLLAIIIRRTTAVDRMNMGSYGQLISRLSTLDSQLSVFNPELSTLPSSARIAWKEVLDSKNAILKKLGKRSLAWVTASGYMDLWQEMHEAEEALINVLPRESVIADALFDEMRIQDSNIGTSGALLDQLRRAVKALDQKAEGYLQAAPTELQAGLSEPTPAPTPPERIPVEEEMQPRSILREVRHALNEFRNSRWQAMVRVRNQFVCTLILTSVTLYVLLEFSILAGAPQQAIIAATAFYLVGALIGLFNRLYSESQTSKSIDDYRLALVRLVATPIYSGLAAVGGVIVVQQFTSVLDILSPKNLLSGLIVAAVFGLTPGLLITRLQNQTEGYKDDLKSTAASPGQQAKIS